MWKLGGKSAALERAEALLSARRKDKKPIAVTPSGERAALSGVGELSDSSAESQEPSDQGPVAAGSRFLKKAPPPGDRGKVDPQQLRPTSRPPETARSAGRHPAVPLRAPSPDSDEEDMRKLLGDWESPILKSPAPPTPVPPPASDPPSRRASPFRFSGRALRRFSPSASPPPERGGVILTPSTPERQEEETSRASSAGLLLRLQTVEELLPPDSPDQESEHRSWKPQEEEELEEEEPQESEECQEQTGGAKEEHDDVQELQEYPSDFESDLSASQIPEELQVPEEAPLSNAADSLSRGLESLCASSGPPSSRTASPSWSSRSSRSRSSSYSSRSSSRSSSHSLSSLSSSGAGPVKDAAVQTQLELNSRPVFSSGPLPSGLSLSSPGPALAPLLCNSLSADMLEAAAPGFGYGSAPPSGSVLAQLLQQQLTLTHQFMETQRRLHRSLIRSLDPPSYRYTTLQGTLQEIRRLRPSRLRMEPDLQQLLEELAGKGAEPT